MSKTSRPAVGDPRGAPAVTGSWEFRLLQGRWWRSSGWAAAGARGGCAVAVGSCLVCVLSSWDLAVISASVSGDGSSAI